MSPLYLFNNKLLVKNGKLATSQDCCCDEDIEVAIYICSRSSLQDDWFDVRLNEKLIGQYQPTQPQTSMLFVTDMNIPQAAMCILPSTGEPSDSCLCSNTTLLNTVQIQRADFIAGFNNTITLTCTQNNNLLNEGHLWIYTLTKNPFKIKDGIAYGTWIQTSLGAVVFRAMRFSNPWE